MDKKQKEELLKLSFEKALEKLEKTVGKMESGNLPLEDMMKAFEEGQTLASICSAKLKAVEKKIETLKKNSNGEVEWNAFEEKSAQAGNASVEKIPDMQDDDSLF